MTVGKVCNVLIRYIVVIGTLNLEFRLQSGPYTVQNTLRHPPGEQRCYIGNRWQLAFTIEKRILDFTQQVFRQIKGLLQ